MIEFDSDTGEVLRTPDTREAVIEFLKYRLNSRVSPEAIRSNVSFAFEVSLESLTKSDPADVVIKKLYNMKHTLNLVLDELIEEFTALVDAAERPQ